jgi:hypothetical protein
MTGGTLTCIGFLVFFQCHEPLPATPQPQKVVCSGPSVPVLTVDEFLQTPSKVKRFMGKVKRNRIDSHCPN